MVNNTKNKRYLQFRNMGDVNDSRINMEDDDGFWVLIYILFYGWIRVRPWRITELRNSPGQVLKESGKKIQKLSRKMSQMPLLFCLYHQRY